MNEPMRILSLGAGVQSSTVALMIANGELPAVSAAVFADTQAEPRRVYDWLDWLEQQLPFPVHRVSQGDLYADVLNRKDGFNPIPAYRDGSIGRRQCTWQYKLRPLQRKQRELAGLEKGERSDGIAVISVMGISWDEAQRMRRSDLAWMQYDYPLIDLRMTRGHCLEWMESHGYPKPPRSACVFCPYKSDAEWRDMEPEEWQRAVEIDNAIGRHGEYLHRSETRLSEADISASTQRDMFGEHCEGMCGV